VVEALLRRTNLWEVRKQRLGGYSGGMRQRFGVAVALPGNPMLMIVEEPTAGLDPAERVRFLNLLSALGENSVVILSTHIVEDVSELCTRMAIIDRGEILLEAEPVARRRRAEGADLASGDRAQRCPRWSGSAPSSRPSSSRAAPSCTSTATRRPAPLVHTVTDNCTGNTEAF
jgi:ABC-type multidrug transport system ATPase subunit